MQTEKFPFALRLVGFPAEEARALAVRLRQAPAAGPAYSCLSDDSLQEPDLFIANGDELKALAALAALTSGDVRPALILGEPALELPYPAVPKPLDWDGVYAELAQLVARRADALAGLAAAGLPPPPERRLHERLDFDLTDPVEYEAQRRLAAKGAVLVVDRNGAYAAHLGNLLQALGIPVIWTGTEAEAVLMCGARAVSVALLNTAIQIDPYRLCAALRKGGGPLTPAVVMLVTPSYRYDSAKARAAGAEGLLDKPVADHHLRAVLKKLMGIA
jgi:CheY-like chemotaxis protein